MRLDELCWVRSGLHSQGYPAFACLLGASIATDFLVKLDVPGLSPFVCCIVVHAPLFGASGCHPHMATSNETHRELRNRVGVAGETSASAH